MALFSRKLWFLSALLIISVTCNWVNADKDDVEEEVIVEVEVDDSYQSPDFSNENVFLAEHFDNEPAFKKKWIKSEATKQGVDENIAKYDGKWEVQAPSRKILKNDLGLVLTTEAKHAAISALLRKPFEFDDKPLIVQYEVTMQEGQVCGGAYIKLLSKGASTVAELRKFHDQTPYTIMFGPDKCGNDNKLHFIFRHRNPKNGTIEEKHAKKPSQRLEDIYKDKEPHLYTLIVSPDNTFKILIDNKEVNSGSLLEDFTPPVNPPEEIDDPNDSKPEDWDEREKIVDPSASKPEDWDEEAPAQIVDPNAVKPDGWLDDEPDMIPDAEAAMPSDWEEEMDGSWEAPLVDNPACVAAPGCGPWSPPSVPNPAYKGKWRAPLITNPNYRGKWSPRRIPNPGYFKDDRPYRMTPIHAVGFELWSMSPMLLFDNLIITDDIVYAEEWAKATYQKKRDKLSKESQSIWGRMLRAMNYSPGYWAMYIVYCLIPITAYVVYLIKKANEASVVEAGLVWAREHPWVYAAALLLLVLLLGLLAYLCCWTSNLETVEEEDPKKTDVIVEDDPHSDEEPSKEEDSESKDDDADSKDDETESNEAETVVEKETKRPGKARLEAEPVAQKTNPADVNGAGDGQRRRKPRKE